jgi:hypothetical protein
MTRWPRFVLLVEVRPPRLREGMPPPAPPILRLRAALKTLLRCFGVVCISVRPAAEPAGGPGAGGGGPGTAGATPGAADGPP